MVTLNIIFSAIVERPPPGGKLMYRIFRGLAYDELTTPYVILIPFRVEGAHKQSRKRFYVICEEV